MIDKEYILFYDSGIGGLTTLIESIKLLPNENYIYFADSKNCPYGQKSKETIRNLVMDNIATIMTKYKLKSMVIACNTATSAAIEDIRNLYPIPIIGIEPNITEPVKFGFNHICVLATEYTAHGQKLLKLEQKYTASFTNISIKNLACLTEQYYHRKQKNLEQKIKIIIRKKLLFIPKTTAIVLGCTHYVFHRKYIESLGYHCFDGNLGTVCALKKKISLRNNETRKKTTPIFISNNPIKPDLKLKKIFLSLTRRLIK